MLETMKLWVVRTAIKLLSPLVDRYMYKLLDGRGADAHALIEQLLDVMEDMTDEELRHAARDGDIVIDYYDHDDEPE